MISFLKRQIEELKAMFVLRHHNRRLTTAVGGSDRDYQSYLELQLARTLSKRTDSLSCRGRLFIDRLAEVVDLKETRVLCVGCRNSQEIEYLRDKGAREVVGIDLYSDSSSVLVMDMHAMSFPPDSFDLLFSCHSLEHAHDPARAAAEFLRVVKPAGVLAIEVPVKFQPSGADLVDFGTLDELYRLFGAKLGRVLWAEEDFQIVNGSGSAAIRSIFTRKA